MQDQTDAGQVGYKTGWMQDRTDAGQAGSNTGWMHYSSVAQQHGCITGMMQDRVDAVQEGCRTGWMQDRTDRTGRMQPPFLQPSCLTGQLNCKTDYFPRKKKCMTACTKSLTYELKIDCRDELPFLPSKDIVVLRVNTPWTTIGSLQKDNFNPQYLYRSFRHRRSYTTYN